MQQKRKTIMRAATKLFVKNGIHGTSMAMLAKKANMATGSIYTYFESKEILIQNLFNTIMDEEVAFIEQGYDPTQSVKERFVYLLRRVILFKIQNPDKFLFISQHTYTHVIMKEIQAGRIFADRAAFPFEPVARDGQEQGIIKHIDDEELFYFVHGGLAYMLQWKLFRKEMITEEDIKHLLAMSWDAIAVKPGAEENH